MSGQAARRSACRKPRSAMLTLVRSGAGIWWRLDGRSNVEKGKARLTRSSGNVCRDLGFAGEDAEHLAIRADLMIQIEKAIKSRRLKQAEAAKVMRATQPRVSDLLRGRINLFSTDTLIDMLARLGARVRLVTRPLRSSRVG